MDRMFASPLLLPVVERFEAFAAMPYLCMAGKSTIGFGHVILPGETWTYPMDRATAIDLIQSDLDDFATKLWPLITRQPTQNQFDAMLSLVFNIGVGVHDGKKGDFADSDLLLDFNKGDMVGAAAGFMDWDKYHDPVTHVLMVSMGLYNRRNAERSIFVNGIYP